MIFSVLLACYIALIVSSSLILTVVAVENNAGNTVATDSDSDPDILPMETETSDLQLERIVEPETEVFETEYVEETEMIEETAFVSEASYYYDVPLDYEIQDHVFSVCELSGVDSALIIAMIYHESGYNVYAIGDNGEALGLMQIQPKWNMDRMNRLQCWDLLNPYQNIMVGVDVVNELMDYGMPTEWVLMAYNGGVAYANDKINRGEVSDYALNILSMVKELK
jgi:hypothetical protein